MLAINASTQPWLDLIFVGGFAFFVINGLMTGNAIVWYRKVKRTENPFLFWFSIITCVLGAVFFLILYFFPKLTQLR